MHDRRAGECHRRRQGGSDERGALDSLVGFVFLIAAVIRFALRSERRLGTPSQRAALATLHTANLAAPALRTGLDKESAERSISHLRQLIGTSGVAIADTFGILAAEGIDPAHGALVGAAMQLAISSARPQVLSAHDLACELAGTCPLQGGIVVPITTDDGVAGAIVALDASAPASLLRLSGEVAEFVSTQLQLAELDRSRRRAVQFELRFLRAQISPHFIYNALTAIESFVRSDPDRARELLVEFADFIRYSFRSHGQFVTVAEELRLVDTYLDLERARFGPRLEVTLRVAPEVLT